MTCHSNASARCRARYANCRLCDYSSLEDKETCQYNKQDHLHGCTHVVPSTDKNGTALRGMYKPPNAMNKCGAVDTTYLSIKCSPDAVSITGEISPGFRANEASSNSFCMSPCPKNPLLLASAAVSGRTSARCNPKTGNLALETRNLTGARQVEGETYRSPRLRAELQSDSVVARSPRLVEPLLILLS